MLPRTPSPTPRRRRSRTPDRILEDVPTSWEERDDDPALGADAESSNETAHDTVALPQLPPNRTALFDEATGKYKGPAAVWVVQRPPGYRQPRGCLPLPRSVPISWFQTVVQWNSDTSDWTPGHHDVPELVVADHELLLQRFEFHSIVAPAEVWKYDFVSRIHRAGGDIPLRELIAPYERTPHERPSQYMYCRSSGLDWNLDSSWNSDDVVHEGRISVPLAMRQAFSVAGPLSGPVSVMLGQYRIRLGTPRHFILVVVRPLVGTERYAYYVEMARYEDMFAIFANVCLGCAKPLATKGIHKHKCACLAPLKYSPWQRVKVTVHNAYSYEHFHLLAQEEGWLEIEVIGFPPEVVPMIAAFDRERRGTANSESAVVLQARPILDVDPAAREPQRVENDPWWISGTIPTPTINEVEPDTVRIIAKFIESSGVLAYQIRRSRNKTDVTIAVVGFFNSVCGQSAVLTMAGVVSYLISELYDIRVTQAGGDWIDTLDMIYKNYTSVKHSHVARKVVTVANHLVMHCLYAKLGINVNDKMFKKVREKCIEPKLFDYMSFTDAVCGTVITILKTGRQAMYSGSIEPFFISGETCTDWVFNARKAVKDFDFIGNPDAVNINLFEYLSNLDKLIEEGRVMRKLVGREDSERKLVDIVLLELESLKSKYLTVTAAQKVREQPLGIVLFGEPGIGKSSVLEAIHSWLCKLRGLSEEPGFKYQFSAEEEYFTNFKTWMHTIVLDDVAQHMPGKIQGVDPSIGQVIRIINNQPYSPPQADVAEKGKTPVMVKTCFVTTNVFDMNIPYYYKAPLAVYRRLPIHIEPIVKPEFRKEGLAAIDSSKCNSDDPYADYWDFVISIPKATQGVGKGVYERQTWTLHSYKELFEYMTPIVQRHDREQKLMMTLASKYRGVDLCKNSQLPVDMCTTCETHVYTHAACVNCHLDHMACLCQITFGDVEVEVKADGPELQAGITISTQTEPTRWATSDGYPTQTSPLAREVKRVVGRKIRKFEAPNTEVFGWDGFRMEWWPPSFMPDAGTPRNYALTSNKEFMDFLQSGTLEELEQKYDVALSDAVKEYCLHLPLYYKAGWSDEMILQDFKWYIPHAIDIEILASKETIVDVMFNEIRDLDKTPGMQDSVYEQFKDWCLQVLIRAYIDWTLFRWCANSVGRVSVLRRLFIWGFRANLSKRCNIAYVYSKIGDKVDERLGGRGKLLRGLIAVFSSAAILTGLWFLVSAFFRNPEPEKSSADEPVRVAQQDEQSEASEDSFMNEEEYPHTTRELQNVELRKVGQVPRRIRGDNKVNVWYSEESTVTARDFVAYKATTLEAALKSIEMNCWIAWVHGLEKANETRVVHVGDGVIMLNYHTIPDLEQFHVTLFFGRRRGGVGPKKKFLVDRCQLRCFPERDVCFLMSASIPDIGKDIKTLFAKESFSGSYDGFYLIPQTDGTMRKHPVHHIVPVSLVNQRFGDYTFTTQAWRGTVDNVTDAGDCGSLLFVDVPAVGPTCVGFHFSADLAAGRVWSTRVSFEELRDLTSRPMVQSTEIGVVGELVEHTKSFVKYHEHGDVFYHGDSPGFLSKPKSRVFKTEIADQLFASGKCGDITFAPMFGAPLMHAYIPQQLALGATLESVTDMHEPTLIKAISVFLRHIKMNVSQEHLDLMHPVSVDIAVNGLPGVRFMEGIKRSTSMGYPEKRSKRFYLEPLEDERWQDGVKFVDDVEDRIEAMLKKYRKNERCHPVFSAQLKDEPVPLRKIESGKTRVFFCCPSAYLVLVRMYFMTFCRVVCLNNFAFCCAVGLNPHSTEWEKLHNYLVEYGRKRFIAGDYENFDKKMPLVLIKAVVRFIVEVLRLSENYSDEECQIAYCILIDTVTPTVDWFGTIITLLGSEVSGHQLTTVMNCIANIFYLMYAFACMGYDLDEFFEEVKAITLGDDHVVGCSENVPKFTHTAIAEVMDELGVGYTMADKKSKSVPYIPIEDCTFLKRTFRLHTNGHIVGPLDLASLNKSLTFHVQSRSISPSAQLRQAMQAAVGETYYHGREQFDSLSILLEKVSATPRLESWKEEYPLPTWEECEERFRRASDVQIGAEETGLNQSYLGEDSYCTEDLVLQHASVRVDSFQTTARAFPKVPIQGCLRLLGKKQNTGAQLGQAVPPDKLTSATQNDNNVHDDSKHEDAEVTTQQEQTHFVNESLPEVTDITTPHDIVANSQYMNTDLSTYLARPAKIYSFQWLENSATVKQASFLPWQLYMNLSSIKNKLQNFKFFRGDLHVKFVINASQFYYGALGAFYTPLNELLPDKFGDTLGGNIFQCCESQKPHVWLNPQSTSTAELKLPFFYFKNWCELTNNSHVGSLGRIRLVQYSALRSANGVTTGGATVTVYAWLENVQVTGNTSMAVLQSKEYKPSGQISGPASTVARVARSLSGVPGLAPYAKATEMASSAIGSVASFFGFTNVPNVADVQPLKSVPFHTLASAHISEPINKLSLQPKQETSIGDTPLGAVGASDDLAISELVQREAFLCGTNWTTSQAVDTSLFIAAVSPELFVASGTALAMPPMCYFAQFFQYWKGDVIFRFKIIRSQYHKGRLSICWDVGQTNYNSMPLTGDPSTTNVVVDLEETDEVEIRIPYLQAFPFLLLNQKRGATTFSSQWSNGVGPYSGTPTGNNGLLQIRVLNMLTSPESTSDVDILVFVRGAENLEFAGPVTLPENLTQMVLQSKVIELGNTNDSAGDKIYEEVFGERIVSMRELLHRQSATSYEWLKPSYSATDNILWWKLPITRLPRCFGYDPFGWEQARPQAGTLPTVGFNWVRNHPINWVVNCFIGYKGSVNYTFNAMNQNGASLETLPSMSVVRWDNPASADFQPSFKGLGLSSLNYDQLMESSNRQNGYVGGATGMALTNQLTQTGLSVNLPYYNNAKFQFARMENRIPALPREDNSHNDSWMFVLLRGLNGSSVDRNVKVEVFAGTGPDFQPVYFLCTPVLYVITRPAPT